MNNKIINYNTDIDSDSDDIYINHSKKKLKLTILPTIPKKNYILPKQINEIKDLIAFAYTFKGNNVNVSKIKNIEKYLIELDNMVGLKSTKRTILDMIMHYIQDRHEKNTDYLHMVVYGPPGCGKTTLCRILGKLLSGLGILSNDTFTLVKRTDLIDKYVGHTAKLTESMLNSCKGGVIFIDEAYSLAPRNIEQDSFAKEAIDFLNQYLSEHKDDICCIIAGYEKELKETLFKMNTGLERRFPWKFIIEDYTSSELLEIFKRMIFKANYTLTIDAIDEKIFKDNIDLFKFSGGDIETFITKCKIMHTRNTFGKSTNNIISKKDVQDALKEHLKNKCIKKNDEPPNHMYI